MSAQAGCSWSAQSGMPWISITGGATGSGPGVVALQVAATDGPARTGTVTVAGRAVTVTQSPGCSYDLAADTLDFGAAGGPGGVAVSAPAGCSWSAQSGVPWISITDGATGSGPGVVALQVAATDGPVRTGTVTVAGSTVTVTQSPGCSYTVNPLTYTAPAAASTSATTMRARPAAAGRRPPPWTGSSSLRDQPVAALERCPSASPQTRVLPRRRNPHRRPDDDRQPGVGLCNRRQYFQRQRRRRSQHQHSPGDRRSGVFLVVEQWSALDCARRIVERQRQWPGGIFSGRKCRPGP